MSREDSSVLPVSRCDQPGEEVAVVIPEGNMMMSSDVFGCCVQRNEARASKAAQSLCLKPQGSGGERQGELRL